MHIFFIIGLSLFAASLRAVEKPNFVFLLVDDIGWADFGCYGAEFNETPNIDRLAKQGMLFENAYAACTVCSPSRAAILSGRYPARLHLTDWIVGHAAKNPKLLIPKWNTRMPHERVLLPEVLKEGGYRTGFFGKWHLMPIGQPDFEKHYPTDHGFDVNVGGREWGQPKGPGKYFSPFNMPNLDDGKKGDFLTDKLTDAALDFMEAGKKEDPFFLYFSYYTVHGPIMAPPNLVKKYQVKAKNLDNTKKEYINPARAGMIEALDNSVGRLMQKLDDLGIADNTVIILTGDNGGNFDATDAGLKAFKGFSHEGGIREPFVVKWPGQTKAGSRSDALVIGTDFYPTLLEMAGLPAKPEEHLDGISITKILDGSATEPKRDQLFWHYPHYHRTKPYGATRHGDWKLIEFLEDGALELYNLKEDRGETTNLAEKNPAKAAELLAELKAWRISVGAQIPTKNPDYDPNQPGGSKAKKKKKN
ncbi:sulfatase [Akkermansiaceae bacterium]|nr:sulfatase [Akkermansiaceae bacterium]MDB4257766.1 sulfatase [bacterium]MDA7536076.1 sulfatase [Akkermansiaceae bacterium]MDA7674964.1 sulfatase [Akkermansiaceae bacterium]MDA8975375.1 sulfatase [Akkermansiaceae bacterium]